MRIEYRSDRRGYSMSLERDLFGTWLLVRCWYGLSSRRGGLLRKPFEDKASALAEMNRIDMRRLRRGYHRVVAGQGC
jgi:predicted DNA-binding WGR domain protein